MKRFQIFFALFARLNVLPDASQNVAHRAGAVVRNPTDLRYMSSIPPDIYKLVPGSFYQLQGLGPSF